jgi:galactonate dehydratase
VVEAAVRHTRPLWIEEPVAAESPAQLARLAEKFVTPIAVGERLVTRWAFREVFERELASIVQPDVANAGGISELRTDRGHGRDVWLGICTTQSETGRCSRLHRFI